METRNQAIVTGWLFVITGVVFGVGRFFMPDHGIADASYILDVIKQFRQSVFCSVIIQITACALYAVTLFSLAQVSYPQKKTTLLGIILFGIGIMGLCTDAIFHLLAYYMTDSSVDASDNIVRIMYFIQTDGLFVVVLLLLPFFIGSLIMAWGLRKQQLISPLAIYVFLGAIGYFVIGSVIVNAFFVRLVSLNFFAIGHAFIGFELIYNNRKTVSPGILS